MSYITGMKSPRSPYQYEILIRTGWVTILAWIATIASGAFLSATMIQGLCLVNYPAYGLTYKPYQGTLITWAVVLVCVFFNTVIGSLLPKVEAAFLILHVLGFFAILIPLVYYGPKGDVTELFSSYLNEGGWSTYGLSFMVGSLGSAFSFVGADAAVHVRKIRLAQPPRTNNTRCPRRSKMHRSMSLAQLFLASLSTEHLASACSSPQSFVWAILKMP